MTFADDIEAVAGGEPIEAVVIGPHGGYGDDGDPDVRDVPAARRGQVLTWAEARPMLDYTYDHGFGCANCHGVWAWTATRVLFVAEYDGATGMAWLPRNPKPGEPSMSGEDG